jgi:copper chaperone CopZ
LLVQLLYQGLVKRACEQGNSQEAKLPRREQTMQRAVFDVPAMYADHHVLAVREALLQTDGVADVTASSMEQRVWVEFDPAKTSPEALAAVLERAGYPVGKVPELLVPTPAKEDGSAWYRFEPRVTQTNMADLEMSGDFRKY